MRRRGRAAAGIGGFAGWGRCAGLRSVDDMTDTATTTVSPTPVAAATESLDASRAAERVVAPTRALSLVSLLLSASALLTGMGLLAVAGVVAGFVARRDEPAHRTLSTWGIVVGFVALFGWVVLVLVGLVAVVPFWLSGALGR